jgi:hypothetical protein
MRVWERFAAVMSENLVKTSTTQSRITWLVSTDFWRVYVEKTKLGNFVFLYESLVSGGGIQTDKVVNLGLSK